MTRFEAWIRRRIAATGLSAEELLARDVETAAKAPYPGPDCFAHSDAGHVEAQYLPAERRSHLASCPMCAALWELSRRGGR